VGLSKRTAGGAFGRLFQTDLMGVNSQGVEPNGFQPQSITSRPVVRRSYLKDNILKFGFCCFRTEFCFQCRKGMIIITPDIIVAKLQLDFSLWGKPVVMAGGWQQSPAHQPLKKDNIEPGISSLNLFFSFLSSTANSSEPIKITL
jgi:hypothetical protein